MHLTAWCLRIEKQTASRSASDWKRHAEGEKWAASLNTTRLQHTRYGIVLENSVSLSNYANALAYNSGCNPPMNLPFPQNHLHVKLSFSCKFQVNCFISLDYRAADMIFENNTS